MPPLISVALSDCGSKFAALYFCANVLKKRNGVWSAAWEELTLESQKLLRKMRKVILVKDDPRNNQYGFYWRIGVLDHAAGTRLVYIAHTDHVPPLKQLQPLAEL
jgi:hypothetical protein